MEDAAAGSEAWSSLRASMFSESQRRIRVS